MNYYQPRQKESDKLWHYTCRNDNWIYPVGYCADGCPGHTTEEEARAHYREYLLNERLSYQEYEGTQHQCIECAVWTPGFVSIDGWPRFSLCKDHQNRETVAKHLSVGNSMSS